MKYGSYDFDVLEKPLKTEMQNYIFYSKYSREKPDGSYETWSECIQRYLDFLDQHLETKFNFDMGDNLYVDLFEHIHDLKIMGSMRAKKSAGLSASKDNASVYNCAYLTIGNVDGAENSYYDVYAFSEVLYLLMCGCGVGFSVERKLTDTLPTVFSGEYTYSRNLTVVEDDRIGWCNAFHSLIMGCYTGVLPVFDLSKIRAYGSKLETLGGFASGPEALAELLFKTEQIFRGSKGRKLKPIECHDICCLAAESTMKGGVRRAALISLSDLFDVEIRDCKTAENLKLNPHRSRANNSYVYDDHIAEVDFWMEWLHLWKSGSGERGFFSRKAVRENCKKINRKFHPYMGTNPCGEISLRPYEFCNLSEVVLKNLLLDSSEQSIKNTEKAFRLATILGTFQSTLTDFRYLRPEWKINSESERLIGVSMTGIADINKEILFENLPRFRKIVEETNLEFSAKLGINPAAASTCVKPSGTVSQLVDCSSGIHECYSQYYLRSVNLGHTEPTYQLLFDQGFPMEKSLESPDTMSIAYFPFKRENSVTQNDVDALTQLNETLVVQEYYANHSVSRTVFVKENEWIKIGQEVYKNLDKLRCLSFFPFDESDSIYPQPVYKRISKEEYEEKLKSCPKIDWSKISDYKKKIASNIEYNKAEVCGLNGCDN